MAVSIDPELGYDVAADAVHRAVDSGAHGAKALHTYTERFEVNFETREITLVRTTVVDNLDVAVYLDQKRGSSEITGRSHDDVDRAVAHAIDAARAGQPDPANVVPEEAAEPAASSGPEHADEAAMIDAVASYLEYMAAEYPQLRSRDVSHYAFESTWRSYVNSAGRTQQARSGHYELVVMVSGRDDVRSTSTSFNYVGMVAREPWRDLGSIPAIQRLFRDTAASFEPRPIPETFVGDVIFTPEAMSTIVSSVTASLTGLALMRKASPFADSLGASIASPSFSLLHRPSELAGAALFDGEGFPNRDLDLVRDGVLQNFIIDWYSSRKLGLGMTTGLVDLVVPPGDTTLDEIVAGTERGILLGRYSGGTPNSNLDFSGVAKNSFYVEDGEIKHPLSETMVAGSFRAALRSIRAVSAESIDYGTGKYPWMSVGGITISTK